MNEHSSIPLPPWLPAGPQHPRSGSGRRYRAGVDIARIPMRLLLIAATTAARVSGRRTVATENSGRVWTDIDPGVNGVSG